MLLTVDANGNDATSPDFDRDNVVQWGFHHQFNDDARAIRHVLRTRHLRRRRRHGADPGALARLVAVVRRPDRSRRRAEPDRARLRHAGSRQRLQHRQRGDGLHPPVVHLQRARRRGQRHGLLGPRRCARVRRRGDGQAARRHVPHPRVDGEPGRSVRGTHLPARHAAPALLDTYGALPARQDQRDRSSPSSTRCSRRASTGRWPSTGWSGRTCPITRATCPTSTSPRR